MWEDFGKALTNVAFAGVGLADCHLPVFDWYFCWSGDAGRAVTSLLPAGGRCRQYVAAHHADCRAGRGDPRSVDPRLPPDKTVDLLEADVPLQFYLGDVDGGDAVSALHGGAGAVAGENL